MAAGGKVSSEPASSGAGVAGLQKHIDSIVDLHRAAQLNSVPALQRCTGANNPKQQVPSLDTVDRTGMTPLIVAARHNSINAAAWLIDHGANVNAAGFAGKTALMHAVQCGHLGVAELLISRNADVNCVDGQGLTPLMAASAAGSMQLIDLLATHGAQINVQSKTNSTALMMAVLSTQTAIVELIVTKLGAALTAQNSHGQTALHLAVRIECAALVDKLLRLGCDPNAVDGDGKRPVDLASNTIRQTVQWEAAQ
ncbi:Ankyrin repeat domain-containing protein [Plasmodiophora brassicae]